MNIKAPFPLSLTQRDIYFDQLHFQGSPIYNVGGYIRINNLNVERLNLAHQKLVMSEQVFGLRITDDNERVMQYVSDERNTNLTLLDFSRSENPRAEADAWLTELFESVYELEDAPLYRAFLLCIAKDEYRYVGFAHHLIMDGWGFANWARRLGEIYNNEQLENTVDSPLWQEVVSKDEQYLQSKKCVKDRLFWQKHCASLPQEPLTPFYSAEIKNKKNVRSGRTIVTLPVQLSEAVDELAKQLGVGKPQIYLSALSCCIASIYDKQSMLFGTPVHNRKGFKEKQMLGVFTSVSPLKVQLSKDASFAQVAQQIAEQQAIAFRHQRYPYGNLVNELSDDKGADKLYQLGFNYLTLNSELSFEGDVAELVYLSHNHERTPLMTTIWEYGETGDVQIQLDYNHHFFKTQEADMLNKRLLHVLSQVVEAPNSAWSSFDVIPDSEKSRILTNTPRVDEYLPKLHDLFEQQVGLSPDKIAVESSGEQLTYQQLNDKALKLAAILQAKGVKPGDAIGLCLTRTLNVYIALYAVLKVGAYYIPLDPKYPEKRLSYIAKDSQVATVVVDDKTVSVMSQCIENTVVINNQELEHASGLPFCRVTEEEYASLAYTIYTSGSTGNPKGVEVTHHSVVSLIQWAKAYFSSQELSRVLFSTSLNFDISVFEIFVPLSLGHTSVLVDNALELLLGNTSVSLINTVPSVIKVLLEEEAIPEGVEVVNLAGEPLQAKYVNSLLNNQLCKRVLNLYGPTEDTVYSTCRTFISATDKLPDIGKVITGSSGYILSSSGELVPYGCVGELYLAGNGLAKSYAHNQSATLSKFVYHSLDGKQPIRMYRTGDLVRMLPCGNIAYLGRIDDQLKVRGFRIEVGEIESHILAQPSIKEVCVMARGEESKRHLVAFVAPVQGMALNLDETKAHLVSALPDYMIPCEFFVLDSLPLTPNGKVDKQALSRIESTKATIQKSVPVTPAQIKLANLWKRLLSLESVYLEDNYFEVGGNSLLVTQLVSAIVDQFGAQISIRNVFDKPVLRDLCQYIEVQQGLVKKDHTISRNAGETMLSSAQQRLWLVDSLNVNLAQYNMPAAFSIKGEFAPEIFVKTVQDIVERHHILRTCFIPDNNGLRIQLQPASALSLSMYSCKGLTAAQSRARVEQLKNNEAQKRFNLKIDLPIRGMIIECDSNEWVVLLTLHHIAADAWSIDILSKEIQCGYEYFVGACDSVPEKLSIQYSDYASWQNIRVAEGAYKYELEYWKSQLNGAPQVHNLPVEQTSHISFNSKRLVKPLPQALGVQLKALAKNLQVTDFTLLQTAFAILVSKASGQPEVCIGTPVAGRNHSQIEPLIGLFVNTLVLRTQIAQNASFVSLLAQNAQMIIDALEHQNIPFEQLVDHLEVSRAELHSPLFQIMFSMQDKNALKLEIPGTKVNLLDQAQSLTKFDLELLIEHDNDKLELQWQFNAARLNASLIHLLATDFVNMLEHIAHTPDSALSNIELGCQNYVPCNEHTALKDPEIGTKAPVVQSANKQTIEKLQSIWCDLLEREEVGIYDDFFKLGGHSLLMAQMIHRGAKQGLVITVKDIFSAPNIVALAALIDSRQGDSHLSLPTFVGKKSALCYSQKRIWLSEKILNNGLQQNIYGAIQITGKLCVDTLYKSLESLIARHEMLRVAISEKNGEPVMTVHDDVSAPFFIEPHICSENQAAKLLHAHAKKQFDMQRAGLFSLLLIQVGEQSYKLHVCLHHIIADGWSMSVIFNELMQQYNSLDTNKDVALEPITGRYFEFAHWQNLTNSQGGATEEFWQHYLLDSPKQFSLPYRKVSKVAAKESGNIQAELSADLKAKLMHLATEQQGSMFHIYHSVLALLLCRVSYEQDINIGIPVTGRHHPNVENIVGMFLNNLPIRTKPLLRSSYTDYLQQQINNVNQVLMNQDLSFERIVELTQQSRETQSTPIFQVFLNVMNLPDWQNPIKHLSIEKEIPLEFDNKFDLTLYVRPNGDTDELHLNFDANIYEQKDMALLLKQYVTLLSSIASDPQVFIGDVPLVSDIEVRQKHEDTLQWQGSVVDLFIKQAQLTPYQVATTSLHRTLTYQSLLEYVDYFAALLQSKGVTQGERVVINAVRSDLLVIALYAVLRAGGAYVILSEEQPNNRLNAQIDISQPSVFINLDGSTGHVYERCIEKGIAIVDMDLDTIDTALALPLKALHITKDSLAYIAFTSGTEGMPKAINGVHGSIAVFLPEMARLFSLSAKDKFAMLSGVTHDPLQRDIFTPLALGSSLAIPTDYTLKFGKISDWIAQNEVTIVHLTPSLARMVMDQSTQTLPSLRRVFLAGEVLNNSMVFEIQNRMPNCEVINLYGSTESCRAVGYWRSSEAKPNAHREIVPVGWGLPGVKLHLLNRAGNICSVGEVGEIIIQSHYLTGGYYQDEALTARKFISLSAEHANSGYAYLTGDLGYRQTDGQVVCFGRKDRQIKIRGFRIELAEIDSWLQSCEAINEGVCHTQVNTHGELMICAYIVAKDDIGVQDVEQQIRDHLAANLPKYMLPSRIINLQKIPITKNGKVDYIQLENLTPDNEELELDEHVTDIEMELRTLWEAVLDRKHISIHADFFSLGGHSLQITKLVVSVEEYFGVKLDYQWFFEHSSIKEVADFICQQRLDTAAAPEKTSNKLII